jgi:hypothetical protein
MIRSRASAKSVAVITSRLSRTAKIAASFARLARSAPENPGVPRATAFRSTPGSSFLPRVCTTRIAARSPTFGSGIVTCRSKRPGRSSAGSSTSGRLVAASTTTPTAGSNPSISASSWLSVCSRSSLATTAPDPARRWPIASTSSMKMIEGARLRACSKRSRTRAAPTPTNISTKLDPVTEKNGTSASPATARASRVLPVPGGPTIRTPCGTTAPARAYRSGLRRKSTTSLISSFAPAYPATSANVVDGRSSSKTLALDRPTPSTPCMAPPAPRDSRIQNHNGSTSTASRISQEISSEPKPADEVVAVIWTLLLCSSFSSVWPACDGTVTV